MSKEELTVKIEAHFKSRRGFISAFNEKAGFDALDETVLSRQINGSRSLSASWRSAYVFFFKAIVN